MTGSEKRKEAAEAAKTVEDTIVGVVIGRETFKRPVRGARAITQLYTVDNLFLKAVLFQNGDEAGQHRDLSTDQCCMTRVRTCLVSRLWRHHFLCNFCFDNHNHNTNHGCLYTSSFENPRHNPLCHSRRSTRKGQAGDCILV